MVSPSVYSNVPGRGSRAIGPSSYYSKSYNADVGAVRISDSGYWAQAGLPPESVLWAIPGAQNYLTYSAPSSYIGELESRVGVANAESFGVVTARGKCITGTCFLAQSTAQSAPGDSGGPFIDNHAMLGTEVGGGDGFSYYDESPNIQKFLPVRIALAG